MKKFFAIIISLLVAISCFAFTACSKDDDSGELNKQEVSSMYRTMAVQMWNKIGVSDPTVSMTGATGYSAKASKFSTTLPDLKTETDNEGHIHNIKYNANDTAGIMYLLSLLYANENFVPTNGIAHFDVSYTVLGEETEQTMYMRSEIDKEASSVLFEVMVSTPKYGVDSYTRAYINFNFETSTLISCRFIMSWDEDCIDMELTADGRYMYYEKVQEDEFSIAVDAMIADFRQQYSAVPKLSANFGTEMQAYIDASGLGKAQLQGSSSEGGEGGGDVGGENGGVTGGDVTQEEGMKPTVPVQQQVSADVWENFLNLTNFESFHFMFSYGEMAGPPSFINYNCNGGILEKITTNGSGVMEKMEYYSLEGGEYYLYTLQGESKVASKVPIDKTTYDNAFAEMKKDYSQFFVQSEFEYSEESGMYFLSQCPELGISSVSIAFTNNALSNIGYSIQEMQYSLAFFFEEVPIRLPDTQAK